MFAMPVITHSYCSCGGLIDRPHADLRPNLIQFLKRENQQCEETTPKQLQFMLKLSHLRMEPFLHQFFIKRCYIVFFGCDSVSSISFILLNGIFKKKKTYKR